MNKKRDFHITFSHTVYISKTLKGPCQDEGRPESKTRLNSDLKRQRRKNSPISHLSTSKPSNEVFEDDHPQKFDHPKDTSRQQRETSGTNNDEILDPSRCILEPWVVSIIRTSIKSRAIHGHTHKSQKMGQTEGVNQFS